MVEVLGAKPSRGKLGAHILKVAAERVLAGGGLTIPNASHIALKQARGTQL